MVSKDDVLAVVAVLSPDEQQVLKDTITEGWWGDCEQEFLRIGAKPIDRNIEKAECYVYCVDDAYKACHYSEPVLSRLFDGIYRKLCVLKHGKIGEVVSHCHDWCSGVGDVIFVRRDWCMAFHEWARDL